MQWWVTDVVLVLLVLLVSGVILMARDNVATQVLSYSWDHGEYQSSGVAFLLFVRFVFVASLPSLLIQTFETNSNFDKIQHV